MRPAFAASLLLACVTALTNPVPVQAEAKAVAVSRQGGSAVSESTDLYEFEFSYPAAAARIAGLRAELERQRRHQRAELIDTAQAERKSLTTEGIEFRPHSLSIAWKTVADLPQWLSLSATVSTYQGGAHPNHGFDAMLWDKAAGVRHEGIDLFDVRAFKEAVKQRFCAALDRERARKREGETFGDPGEWMNACIDPVEEATVILGSSSGRTFDRVGFLIAPYAAGPYAEGSYEVTLPIDRALLQAVKLPYRGIFISGR